MTNDPALHPAEERLLDAALAQHFAAAPSMPRVATGSSRWLAAALVLLGLGVVTSIWAVTSTDSEVAAQQPEPLPLPPEVMATGKTEIERLPLTTENLLARFVDPTELPVITRLPKLRGLRLWAKPGAVRSALLLHTAWSNPPADLLQPLAKLPHLEVLGLADELALSPGLLAPLAGHPTLHEIQLVRSNFVLDDAMVASLARIPQLRSLDLRFVPLSSSVIRCLAKLPLTSLRFDYCQGLDAEGWQALLTMRNLRRLTFRDWSWNFQAARIVDPPAWRPTIDDLRQLQQLPHLRSLELLGCDIDDEQFAALPDTLTTLRVSGTRLTPEGIVALRRCLALRELMFSAKTDDRMASLFAPESDDHANAFAAAIEPLRLHTLDYRGALTTDVIAALGAQRNLRKLQVTSKQAAAGEAGAMIRRLELRQLVWHAALSTEVINAVAVQPELRELELHADAIHDISALAKAPKLERLTLSQTTIGNGIPASVLEPLAQSTTLREIAVHVSIARGEPHPSEPDLQLAVGERIRVRLHETEFTVRK